MSAYSDHPDNQSEQNKLEKPVGLTGSSSLLRYPTHANSSSEQNTKVIHDSIHTSIAFNVYPYFWNVKLF